MKILFSLSLLMSLSLTTAARADSCVGEVSADRGADVTALVQGLRNRGFTELTTLFDNKRIDLEHLSDTVTTSPLVRVRLPGFRRKRAVLEYARLNPRDEVDHQRAQLELIKGLFAIELNARFRDYPPRAGAGGLRARPRQVGQYQAGRITALLADFYRALGDLTLLNAAGLLPSKDPGRPWMAIAALVKGPPRQLKANQHDLEKYFLVGAEEALKSAIGDRYEKALMYAHGNIYAKRVVGTAAVVVGTAVGVSMLQPSGDATQAPAPEVSASQDLDQCIPESQMTEAQKDMARAKLKRLRDQLEKVRHHSGDEPRTEEIERIKQQILDHTNCHPFLMLPSEPSR